MSLRSPRLVFLATIAVVLVGGWFGGRTPVDSVPLVADQSSPLLEQAVSIDATATPLSQVVARLARELGLQFRVDQTALQSIRRTGDERISFTLPNVKLRHVLDLLPEQVDPRLRIELHSDSILLTAVGNQPVPEPIETRLYPLTEVMANPVEFNSQALADVIQIHIHPDSWERVGGPFLLESFPTAFLISATADAHAEIEMLLQLLAQIEATGFQSLRLEPDDDEQRANCGLEARLQEPITIDFQETPLTEVVRWLRDDHDLPILIDHRELLNLGFEGPFLPVTVSLRDVSLRSALRWVLRDWELGFVVRNGVVLITIPGQAGYAPFTRLYPVDDLRSCLGLDLDTLASLVTSSVARDMQVQISPQFDVSSYGGCLIVTQYQEFHDQLQSRLDDLRRGAFPYLNLPSRPASLPGSTARIEQALSEPSNFEAHDEPFADVAARLAHQLDINVVLDRQALADIGLAERTEINIPSSIKSFGENLSTSFESSGLGYIMHNEVLLLTSFERAEAPVTRIYPVADLCGAASHRYVSTLEQFVSAGLVLHAWPGDYVVELLGTLLVVRARPTLHLRVGRVLEATRQWRAAGKPDEFCWPGDESNDAISFYNVADLLERLPSRYNGRPKNTKPWYLEAVPSNRHWPINDFDEPVDEQRAVEQQITEAIQLVLGGQAPEHCMIFRDGLVTFGNNEQHALVQTAVDRLRQFLRLEHGPDEIVSLPATAIASESMAGGDYLYFDVQPVLRRHPTWAADDLAAFLLETLQPGDGAGRFPGIATLPGLLALRKDDAYLLHVDHVLHYLAFEMEQPAALRLLDSPEQVEQPVLDFLTAELSRRELCRRALATRLLREVREPPESIVEVLTQQLSKALEHDERALLSLTLMAFAQYGERAEPALPSVEIILSRPESFPDFPNTQLAIQVLIACRAKALPTLERLLTGPDPLSTDYLIQILEGLQDDAQPLTAEILLRVEQEGADWLGPVLVEIDPAGARSREVLRAWRNSPDAAVRTRALKIGEFVHPYIGD